jgi:enolase-phosphatase E1
MWKWICFFSFACPPLFSYQAILTDIEGTTTSISFVHDILFPYAKKHLHDFVINFQNDPFVKEIIDEVNRMTSQGDIEQTIATLRLWMDEDRKVTPLKTLQGMMWKEGYERGDFVAHVYQDAFEQLKLWKKEGLSLYVYSSGSVPAQILLFGHTPFGDLTSLFSGYFDTKIGGKKEVSSYFAIAKQIGIDPKEVLFLSDSIEELNAAKQAEMATIFICREGKLPATLSHKAAANFHEITIR